MEIHSNAYRAGADSRMRAGDGKLIAVIATYAAAIALAIGIIISMNGRKGDRLPETGISLEEMKIVEVDEEMGYTVAEFFLWGADERKVPFQDWIEIACAIYGVSPDIICSIIELESGWDAEAVNPRSGAQGLMQIAPGTWEAQVSELCKQYHVKKDFNPLDRYDNVCVGAYLLSSLFEKSNGMCMNALPYALDCYALGEGGAEERFMEMEEYAPTEWTICVLERALERASERSKEEAVRKRLEELK